MLLWCRRATRLEAIAVSNKKLLGALGIATRSKKLLGWRPRYYTRQPFLSGCMFSVWPIHRGKLLESWIGGGEVSNE